jgi:TIR domain
MADVFISYSKSDHALALKLSTFLESEGWTVWWDKSLGAADLYRDEIMKQLVAARAVITIWSPNSIRSDWVRAEAGRAKAGGKLIPVKTPELNYADIPLPFGEMHTENVASTELIRAAIVAQLAKPAVSQSPFWQITSTFKYQILTWIGIVGSAITLFANLSGVLNLADWARELVAHWHEWNQMVWGWMLGLIDVSIPRVLVPLLSFTAFALILVVGVNYLALRARQNAGKSQNGTELKTKVRFFVVGVLLYIAIAIGGTLLWLFVGLLLGLSFGSDFFDQHKVIVNIVAWTWVCLWAIGFPLAYLGYRIKQWSWIFIDSLLFLLMGVCLLLVPVIVSPIGKVPGTDFSIGNYLAVSVLFQILWMAVILFSPLPQLTRRLGYIVLGVLTLLVLSEISKLNLHQYLQPTRAVPVANSI